MENNKIPTAEEFISIKLKEYAKGINNSYKTNYELELERLVEFAKMHVEAALKEAGENAQIVQDGFNEDRNDYLYVVDEQSILNSYPLSNIK